ncbi:NTP transferase domain-containing protein [Streptomyces sp. NPDC047097]|uniref:cytidylyltransferase domain-containing protein n=1 Tax=Streptomyces sp. NPDC047097 TaxID=3155260 RepID=UPI003401734F
MGSPAVARPSAATGELGARPSAATTREPGTRPLVLAVIPARGGSKGVPGKNLARIGGVPLVARAVRACRGAARVTDVVVSTDDPEIAAAARAAGAEPVDRPTALSGDAATSEAAVLHALDTFEATRGRAADVVLLVQCTSPFLTAEDVDAVTARVLDEGADSALTAAPSHGFLWRGGGEAGASVTEASPAPGAPEAEAPGADAHEAAAARTDGNAVASAFGAPDALRAAAPGVAGAATSAPGVPGGTAPAPGTASVPGAPEADAPGADRAAVSAYGAPGALRAPLASGAVGVNHDKAYRPRRQDREPEYLETGAAYAMDAAGFRTHRHRFFGRTALAVTDPARVLEIDDPHDLARARALAPLLDPVSTPTLADVDAVVLDFDGTQTDDRVLIDADGREFVAVHRGDGLGTAALRRSGLRLLILSTEQNPVVAARARKLGVPVLHGVDRKDLALKRWCDEQGVDPTRVLYAGNDANDLGCFALVGWPVAVASAHDAVRAAARAVTAAPGGEGAIREIAAWLLGPTLHHPAAPTP